MRKPKPKIEKECVTCKKTFMTPREAIVTCSAKCRAEYKKVSDKKYYDNVRKKKNDKIKHLLRVSQSGKKSRICRREDCGKEFIPYAQRSKSVYCTNHCRDLDNNKKSGCRNTILRKKIHELDNKIKSLSGEKVKVSSLKSEDPMIQKAMDEFLKKGGMVTRVPEVRPESETDWLYSGNKASEDADLKFPISGFFTYEI